VNIIYSEHVQENVGKINVKQFRDAVMQFAIPLSSPMTNLCFDYCDTNKDGFIDFVEFANFLNIKDGLPLGVPLKPGYYA